MSRSTSWAISSLGVGLLLFLMIIGFRADTLPYPPEAKFSDASISRYPDALYFQRSLRDDHTLPLWNPHLMGGQPFAANPGTKVWYPLTWLLLILNPMLHINLMTAIHLWWGAVGMWLWSRRTGLRTEAAALSAIAYLFAPKLIAHGGAGHTDLLIAMAWLPWLLYALHHFFREPITARGVIGLAFVIAMLFIGAIQLLPFTLGLGGIYALSLGNYDRWRWLPVTGILALGMSAIQWLPLLELRSALSRGELRPADAAIFSLKPGELVGLLIGNHGGGAESITYVGVSVLVLALVGLLITPQQRRLWWAISIGAILYAFGDNFLLWSGLIKIFPPLLYFRVPSRAWFLVALIMPYLAGWGLQTLMDTPPHTSRARLLIVALIGLGVTCNLASLVMLREALADTALLGLAALPLIAALIALRIFERLPAKTFATAVIVLVIADCLWIDLTLIEGRQPPQSHLPPEVSALLENGHRLYTPSYTLEQHQTAEANIPRFDGVDPFQLQKFVEISVIATGVPRAGYSTTVPAIVVLDETTEKYQAAPLDLRLLGQWGVAVIATSYPLDNSELELIAQDEERYFYQNPYAWEGVQITWESPNRVTQQLDTDAPVMTIANAPGWQSADGTDIDPSLASLPAQNGTFIYRPPGVYLGAAITGFTYLLAFIWLLIGWRRGA